MGLDTDLPRLEEEANVSNGVKVLLYRNTENPTLTVHGSLKAGTAYEPLEQQGVAELTARLLIRGTRKLGAVKLADLLESVGAAASFRNTQDTIIFQARTTSTWTKRVLKALSGSLTIPALNARDVEKEKEELLTDIRLRDDDTTRRGVRELQRVVYPPNHPYRRDRLGTAESVKKIQRSDVVDFFREKISRAEVVVAFAGMFEKNEVIDWAENTFGEREKEADPPKRREQPVKKSVGETREIVMPHKTQADVMMGSMAVSRTNSDYEPLNLLNVVLGELGFMGRLGQRVRDKEGLAYSCTSFLNVGALGGSWTALAGVNPRNIARATELMREEIGRVCKEQVDRSELDLAKQNQMGSAVMELESTEGVARTSHNLVYFRLGLDYYTKRRQLYKKISEPDLLEMARKYIEPSRLSTIIIGPRQPSSSSKS